MFSCEGFFVCLKLLFLVRYRNIAEDTLANFAIGLDGKWKVTKPFTLLLFFFGPIIFPLLKTPQKVLLFKSSLFDICILFPKTAFKQTIPKNP